MIFSRELKSNISKLFAWLLVLSILLGLLMAVYPIMLDSNMKSIFDSFTSSLSTNVKSILGFHDDLDYTNMTEYIGFIYQYIAVFVVMFAMQLGANSLAKEQANGSIGYIYSNPISRSEIVTQKFLANVLVYLIMVILLGCVTIGISLIIGPENIQNTIFGISKVLAGIFLSGIVFMAIGMFFSSLSKSITFTEGTSILFVLLTVLVAIFGKVYGATFETIVSYLTLETFNPVLFVTEKFNFAGIGVNVVLIIIFILLSYLIYNSKELEY